MQRDREYEVKLSLPPEDTERLLSHPILTESLAERRTSRFVSTYFDTPDARLRRKRVSLRVRQCDTGTTQTLKRSGLSMVDRSEWEHDGAGKRPDPNWLRTTPLKSLFKQEKIVAALDEQFAVETSRTIVPVSFAGGTIECALDQGSIRAKNLSLPLSEIELELKAGSEDSVMALAKALARDLPLILNLTTKAERGYSIADLTWGKAVKNIPLDLSATRTIGDLVTGVTQACLHTICRNAAIIGTAGDTVEAVHKTRIALRHLRAALRLFRPVLRQHDGRALNGELRWISAKLGEARDADVFQMHICGETERDTPGGAKVADIMHEQRDLSHARLRRALESERWRCLLLDVLAFSTDGVRDSKRRKRAAPFIRHRLAELHGDLARRTRRWSHRTTDEMHEVRKRAKILRYDLDLVGTVPKLGIKKRKLKHAAETLQTMQQTLGDAHDRIALREKIGEVILRRKAPNGTSGAQWEAVREAARRLAASSPQDNVALGKAHEAARRLRRRRL